MFTRSAIAPAIPPSPNDAAADDAGAPVYEGIVLHSSDDARSWTVLTTTPSGALFAIGGSPDGARIDAVGEGYTMTESIDHGATWLQRAGSSDHSARADLTAVWVRSASDDPDVANEMGLIRQIDGVEPDPITS